MDTVPYILMQDRLSTGGSFILCDCNANGFPIRYASTGFCDLFEYTAAECKGSKCGDLVAEPAIRAHDPELGQLSAAVKLDPTDADRALSLITGYVVQECKAMMAHPTQLTGFALVPNRAKDGTLKVIELAMVVCRHPTAGWLYSVGLQTDVTREVSLEKLFAAAGAGTTAYSELVKAQESAMQARLHLLDIQGSAMKYLDVKATEMWETLMLEALGVEVKHLSAVSELSTTNGSSVCTSDASSSAPPQEEEFETQSNCSKAQSFGKPGALERIFEVPPSTSKMNRINSDCSTGIPDSEVQAFSRHGTDESTVVGEFEPMATVQAADIASGAVKTPDADTVGRSGESHAALLLAETAARIVDSSSLIAGAALAVGSATLATIVWRRSRA